MRTSLEIENVTSWKSTGQIRLAPITACFGSHSFCTTVIDTAVDTDWLHYHHVLATHGVTVVQLCPRVLEEMSTGRG